MNVKLDVCARLDDMGIKYEMRSHPRVFTITECTPIEALMGGCVARNLFLAPRNLKAHYLLLAHPTSVFRTSNVSRQAGASRLAFAPEEDMLSILRTHPGAVSPLGLLFDERRETRVLIDNKLAREEWLIFHPCDNDASVKLSKTDFLGVFLPALNINPTFVDMD